MNCSNQMRQLLYVGYVCVCSMDYVINLQEESVKQGILIDYKEVLIKDHGKAYKVFQVGGDE